MHKKLMVLALFILVLGVSLSLLATPADPVTPEPGQPVFCACSIHCGIMSFCSAWGPCPCDCHCEGYTAVCGCNWGSQEL
jgi:hypothetical protein